MRSARCARTTTDAVARLSAAGLPHLGSPQGGDRRHGGRRRNHRPDRHCHPPVSDFRVDVWLCLARNGYAQATVNRWQVILCHMYKMAKKWGIPGSERNPLEGVQQKPCNNEIERFLTPEETRRLQAAVEASANTQLKYIVALLLLTGCRKRELLDAKWEEFQLDRKMWRIPMQRAKTSKTRHVPLSTAAMEILAQLPRWEGCPYVVPNPKTLKPFWSVYHCWDKARKAAGLPDVRMHDLRHSAASNLVNSGQSLYVVGSILGHAQTKTTQRYAHLDNSTLLSAANAAADHMDTDWSRKTG